MRSNQVLVKFRLVIFSNIINFQIHRRLRGIFALHAKADPVQGWRGERRTGRGHFAVAGCAVQNQRKTSLVAGWKLPYAVGAQRYDEA